jgi:hypothetical protein
MDLTGVTSSAERFVEQSREPHAAALDLQARNGD